MWCSLPEVHSAKKTVGAEAADSAYLCFINFFLCTVNKPWHPGGSKEKPVFFTKCLFSLLFSMLPIIECHLLPLNTG